MWRTTRINRIAIGDTLRRSAARDPEAVALVDGTRRYNYRDLDTEVNRFANYLLSLGIPKGAAVATLCLNSADLVIAVYGIAKAGLVWVPVNALLQGEALRYILEQVEVQLVIADDELLAHTIVDIRACCQRLLVISASGAPMVGTNEHGRFADALTGQPSDEPQVDIDGSDLAQVMYTSGTTARQKGVMISHQAVYISSLANAIEADVRPDDTMAAVMPIFHCAQHTLVATVLCRGGTVAIVRRFEPESFMHIVSSLRVSWLFMLPMMYRAVLDHPRRKDFDLSSLRYCMYGMAPIDRTTLLRLTQELCPSFALGSGQTEAYPASCVFKPEYQLAKSGPYWGEPSLIDDMAIMDDNGNLLPRGAIGELVMRGPNVMLRVLQEPRGNGRGSRFGWHHTRRPVPIRRGRLAGLCRPQERHDQDRRRERRLHHRRNRLAGSSGRCQRRCGRPVACPLDRGRHGICRRQAGREHGRSGVARVLPATAGSTRGAQAHRLLGANACHGHGQDPKNVLRERYRDLYSDAPT